MTLSPFLIALLAASTLAGCSKKETSTAAPPPETAAAAPAAPGPAENPTGAAPAAPVDTSRVFNDASAALKAKDYQKAADTLLVLQQQQLNEQQAQALRGQMVQLQGALAAAVASGDPNAKAAADRLRASSMH